MSAIFWIWIVCVCRVSAFLEKDVVCVCCVSLFFFQLALSVSVTCLRYEIIPMSVSVACLHSKKVQLSVYAPVTCLVRVCAFKNTWFQHVYIKHMVLEYIPVQSEGKLYRYRLKISSHQWKLFRAKTIRSKNFCKCCIWNAHLVHFREVYDHPSRIWDTFSWRSYSFRLIITNEWFFSIVYFQLNDRTLSVKWSFSFKSTLPSLIIIQNLYSFSVVYCSRMQKRRRFQIEKFK